MISQMWEKDHYKIREGVMTRNVFRKTVLKRGEEGLWQAARELFINSFLSYQLPWTKHPGAYYE